MSGKQQYPSSAEVTAQLFGLEEGSRAWKLRKDVEQFMLAEVCISLHIACVPFEPLFVITHVMKVLDDSGIRMRF